MTTKLAATGRIALAEIVFNRSAHLAWGRGDGIWVSPPEDTGLETALVDEIARRKPSVWQYVYADPAGTIIVNGPRFSPSSVPTREIRMRFEFDYEEAVGEAIREVAFFSGGSTTPGLPEAQMYFEPADVVTPGRLMFMQNFTPIARLPSAREWFEFVLSF